MQISTNTVLRTTTINASASLSTTGNKKHPGFRYIPTIMKVIFTTLFISMFSFLSQAQYSNVPVSGFNDDIVANGVGAGNTVSTGTLPGVSQPTICVDGNTPNAYALIDATYKWYSGSTAAACFLPTGGAVPSALTSGLTYQLQSYSANNALTICSNTYTGSVFPTTGSVSLVTPASYGNLYILYETVVNTTGPTVTATVTFTDNSTQVLSGNTVNNWFTATNVAYSPSISRTPNTAPGTPAACSGGPYLFQMTLPLSAANLTKAVQSISFSWSAAIGSSAATVDYLHIMAVGGLPTCTQPADGATALTQGATSTSSIAASFTAAASAPSGYLEVAYPTGASPIAPANGTTYTAGQTTGTGKVIQSAAANSFTATGLSGGTTYDIYVYSYNSGATCGGPVYNTLNVLSGSLTTTACGGLAGGTYSVGPTGTYLTLTGPGGALTAVAGGISGPVILELQAGYLSTAELSLPITFPANACIGPVNTLIIRPASGATGLSLTSANATGTINFNGASYVTIDGRPGGTGTTSQLTISNTNAGSSYAVQLTGDATNNAIKYCTITSVNNSATSGTIVFGTGTTTGNDNNIIDNCSILDGTSTPLNGIYSAGASTSIDNSGNIISNNNIANYFGAAANANGIYLASNSSGWTISGNRFYQTATRTSTAASQNRAIQILTASGGSYTIINNIIGFANAAGTGVTTYAGSFANRFVGIELTGSTSFTSSMQGNTISNISVTTSTAGTAAAPIFGGIVVLAGNANIGTTAANTIGGSTGTGAVTVAGSASSYYVEGIYATSTGTVRISGNNIGSINATGSTASISTLFYGIYALGTAGNFTITNNTIGSISTANSIVIGTDLISTATSSFYGIRCDNTGNLIVGGGAGLGNTIQNIALRSNSTAPFYGYYVGAVSGSPTFTFNTLTAVAMGWTTTPGGGAFTGFYNASTQTSLLTFSNNIIQGIPNLNTTGIIYIIFNNSNSGNTNVQNNTINNITRTTATATSGTFYGFYNALSPTGIQNVSGNIITNITAGLTTGSTGFIGIYNLSSAASTWNIFGNNISTITAGSTTSYGIYNAYGPSPVYNNTINNISTGGTLNGLYIGGSFTTASIYNNVINTLSSTGASSVIYGINTSGTTPTFYKNKVYDITATGASGIVYGFYTGGGTTITLYNNLFGDLKATISSLTAPAPSVATLYISSGTTINAYYNTFQLNASSTGTNFGTASVYAATGSTVNLRNNIFVNNSTPNGAGKTVSYQRSTTTLTSYASTSNNNLFYAGTPSATRVIYFDGTNADQTFGAFQTRVSTRDAASVTENPPFLSTSGASSNFLHISTAIATQLESGGAPIASYTDDFDGDARNATTPDIGADEFNGILSDQTPPSISAITLAGNACSLTSRNVTAQISDLSGVDNSSLQPAIYFRKNGGAYSHVAGSLTSGTVNSGTWTFTITYATVGGVVPTDVIDYFIVAQDVLGNASGNPSAGLVITNVNTVTSFPTTPLTYNVQNSLSGTFTVGTGGNYATLTAAVAAYNNSCLAGPIIFSLTSASYTEAAALTINANADASAINTLTIKPTLANTTIAVTGGSSSAVFILNGADYVTLNGSISNTSNTVCPAVTASRDLTITNTNTGTSSAVIWLQTTSGGDATTNNIIKNCNLVGSGVTATLFGAGAGSSTISISSLGTANNNNSFINNNISGVQYGIYTQGASAANKNSGTIINQNLVTASAGAKGGIWAGFENNITISGNSVSNILQTGSPDVFGISCGFGTSMSSTTSGGNDVSNATITKNIIGSVANTGTFSAYGIGVSSATTGTTLIADNMVYGVASNGTGLDFAGGIVLGGGAGTTNNVYYNTVSMQGTIAGTTAASQTSACLAVTNSTAPILDLRNNIFSNTQLGNSSATVRFAAIALGYSSFTTLTSNNNDLYASGAGPGTYTVGITGTVVAGTNSTTLANWQTTTGKDGASKSVAPIFVSATNLHLAVSNIGLDNFGAPVSVTDDIDCESRNVSTPDIGADEFTATAPAVINSVTASPSSIQCTATARTITANVTAGGTNITSVTLNYSFNGVAQSPVTMTGGNPNANQTSNWTGVIPAATPSTATVTWTVTVTDGTGSISSAGTGYADNPLAGVTATASASLSPVCAGSPTSLSVVLATATTYANSFETGVSDFATSSVSGTPVLSQNSTYYSDGTKSMFFNTASTSADVSASSVANINLSGMTQAVLTFSQVCAMEGPSFSYDYGYIQYSSDGGTTWTSFPTSSYAGSGTLFNSVVSFTTKSYADWISTFTGTGSLPTNALFHTETINIPAAALTSQFRLRFRYTTDGSTNYFGWLIDNVKISAGIPTATAYSWSNGTSTVGTTNPLTVNPTTNTSYTVTVTAAGCTVVSSPVTVNTIPLPTAPTPHPSSQCGIGVPIAFVGTTNGTSGTGGFRWYNAQTGGTLIQTGGDSYTGSINMTTSFWVSEVVGTCESPRVELVATVGPADPISASADHNNVCNNTTIQLSAANTATPPVNTYTYSWNASPLSGSGLSGATPGSSISVTPTAAGTYTYTVTATDATAGCVNTNTVTVTVKSLPVIVSVTATPGTVCAGAASSLTAATNAVAPGSVTLGTGTSTYATSSFPAVPYAQYDEGGNNEILVKASELTALGLTAGNLTSLKFNVSNLNASGVHKGFTIRIKHTSLTALSAFDLTSMTTVFGPVDYQPIAGINTHSFDTPFNWDGVSNILIDICFDNEPNATSGTNYTNNALNTYTTTSFNSIVYYNADGVGAVRDMCGAPAGANVGTSRPNMIFGGQVLSTGPGSLNWAWNPGALPGSTVTVNPTVTTLYTVTATDLSTTCSNTATVTVNVNPLPALPSGNNGDDQCGTGLTNASVSSNTIPTPPSPIFKWYLVPTGGTAVQTGTFTTYQTQISQTTDFYVSEYSAAGCEGPRVHITTIVGSPDPILVSATPMTVCLGGSTSLAVNYTPDFNSFATYTLTVNNQTGSGITNPVTLTANETGDGTVPYTITPTAAGTYIYTVSAYDPDKFCTAVNTVTVTVNALPTIQSFTATPSTICAGASVNLVAIGAPHYTNVAVSGYNTDEVANGVGAVSASTTGTFDTQYTFAASDWNFNGSCTALSFFMPVSGKVNGNATVAPGVVYNLQPYTGNNALRVPATGTAAGSGTLTVTSPVRMKTVYLLYGAGNGPLTSGMNVTVTFTDATTQVFTGLTALDWYATTNPAISNLGRLDRTTTPACAATVTSGPQLFDLVLALNASNYTKLVQSIKVDKTATTGTINVLGVAMEAPSYQSQPYTWTINPGNFTDSAHVVNPTTTTTYTATVTDPATTCSASATVTVTVNQLPVAPATNDPVMRCGPGSVTLTATGSGGTLNWYNVATGGTSLQTGGTYTTNVTGNISFWVAETSGPGCEGPRTQVHVTVTTAPTLVISAPPGSTTFCQGGSVTLNGSSQSDPSYINFSWSASPSAGSGLSSNTGSVVTATPTVAGTYLYTLTANDGTTGGCANTATITVTANANPIITSVSASPTTVCANGASTLTAVSINALPGTVTVGNGTSVTATNTTIGTFYGLYYGNGHTQVLFTAAELTAAGLTPGNITSLGVNVASNGNGTALNGFTIKLATTTATSITTFQAPAFTTVWGPANYNPVVGVNTHSFTTPFTWDGTSNLIVDYCFSNQITGTTTTAVTNSYTTTSFNSFVNYQVDGATGATACTTTTVTNSSTSRPNLIFGGQIGTVVTGNYSWVWNPGGLTGSTVVVHPTTTTSYTATATIAATQCSTTSTPVTVNVTPVGATATASPSTPVCVGTSVTLNAGPTGGAPFSYSWSDGTAVVGTTNPLTVTPNATTTYTVTVTDACGNTVTSSVTVIVNPIPTASIAETTPISICSPSTQVLTAVTNAASPSYQWTLNGANIPGAISSTYIVSGIGTGSYRVVVTNGSTSCVSAPSAAVIVTINALPAAVTITPSSATICNGGSQSLTASSPAGSASVSATTGTISIAIPDVNATGITNSLALSGIPAGATIDSVITTFSITHGFDEDIQINLKAPNGQILNLVSGGTGYITSGTNFTNTSISSDNSKPALTTGSAPFTGTFKADAATSGFELAPAASPTTSSFSNLFGTGNGTWSLNVIDDESIGTGSLTNWQIKVSYTVPTPIFTWSPATGLNTTSGATVIASPSATTTYTATATNTASCSVANTVTVTVNPRPTGIISGSTSYCNGQSTITNLSIAVTGAGPWSGTITDGTNTTPFSGSTSPISVAVTPTAATTTYTIATLNGSACSAIAADLSGSATVTVNPRPTGVITGGGTYCNGANTATVLSIAVTGSGPWTGTLSDGTPFSGSTSPISVTVTPTATTTYTIATLNGSACSAIAADLSGSATVTINPRPTGVLSGSGTYCNGANTATVLSIAVTGSGPWSGTLSNGTTFSGSTSPISVTVTPTATTTYTIATLNGSACSAIAADLSGSATVTVNPRPTGVISGGGTYCNGANTATVLSIAVTGSGPWTGTLSNGATFSGSTSPISVTVTPTATTTYTIATLNGSVCSAIAADLSGSATVTVNPLAANPTATVMQPTCTTATGTITVTSPLGAGNTYSINGTTYQPGTTFSNVSPGTYNLTVQTSSGCFSPASTSVTVNPQPFTPAAPVISGTVNVCPYINTGTQLTYTATAAGATSFNWSIPANVAVVSGMGTGTLVVTFSTGFAEQAYKQFRVTATSVCGTSPMTIFYLLAQYPSTPSPITGPANTCPYVNTGTIVTYTIPAATSATSYAWTVPTGAHIVSGQGTTSIGVTYDLGFAGGTMSVNSVNTCGPSGPRTLTLTARAASQPSPIAGSTNACPYMAPNGTPATYSTPVVSGATTYTWTAPAGAIVTHPNGIGTANDTLITVLYPAGFTSGTITVTATNGCGTSPARSLNITRLNPATPSVIDVIQTHFCGESGGRVFTYTLSSMPYNATSILWTVPAGATILSGQGTISITVSYPDAAVNGNVTAQAINNCSSSSVRISVVKLPACPPPGFSGGGKVQSKGSVMVAETMEVKVFPNPTVSDFKMEVITSAKEEINVRVIDAQGKLYKTFKVMPYQTVALGAELKAGSYLLEVRQGREVRTTKVIKF